MRLSREDADLSRLYIYILREQNNNRSDLHPFAVQKHVQFGTRCQHEQEGLEGCEGYDQSKSKSPRICLAACI